MPTTDDISNASDAMKQYGAITSYGTSVKGRVTDRNKFGAETTNDWAMALYNAAQEQYQWERNIEYNDPINEYARLVNAGMNPLLAMRSVAGEGSQAPSSGLASGSSTAKAGSGSEQASASRLQNALSAASNISNAAGQLADIRLKNMTAREMPGVYHTQQDLNQAQAYLARQNADYVPRIAESSSNASDARAKHDAAQAAVADEMKRLTKLQANFQAKELQWYDARSRAALDRNYQEIRNLVQDVRESISRVAANKSGIELNTALRSLYRNQSILLKTQRVSQSLDNMYKSTGVPPSIAGAALLNGMSKAGLFSTLGEWKMGTPFSEGNPLYDSYETLRQLNFDAMIATLKVDSKANAQWWINNIYNGVNAASGVAGAASGLKNSFAPAPRPLYNNY